MLGVIGGHCLAQPDHAVGRRVIGLARGQGPPHPVEERVGRRELGGVEVPDGEVADLRALGLGRSNLRGDAQDLGTDDAAREIGE